MGKVSGEEKLLQGQGAPEQPDLVSGTPARGGGLELDGLKGRFQPRLFHDSMTCTCFLQRGGLALAAGSG